MGSIITSILAGIFKGFLGMFAKSTDEKLGIQETENASAKKTISSLETVIAAGGIVDNAADADKLRDKLNARPE